HDTAWDVHEEPARPHRRVVGGELLVPADERVEKLVVLGELLEPNAVGSGNDLESGLAHVRDTRSVELEHRRRRGDLRRAVGSPRVRIEPLQVREAPMLVFRRRKRERAVALEQLGAGHASYRRWSISAFPSGSLNHAWRQTLVAIVSPSKATPFASGSPRAASTSGPRSARPAGEGANGWPMLEGSKTSSVT